MATQKGYTPGEDSALLAFVEANKHRSPIRGNKLWRLAEAEKVTPHTWQSMKAHYELITGEKRKKGQKREKKKSEAEAQKRLGFNPSTSTSTSTPRHYLCPPHQPHDRHLHPDRQLTTPHRLTALGW